MNRQDELLSGAQRRAMRPVLLAGMMSVATAMVVTGCSTGMSSSGGTTTPPPAQAIQYTSTNDSVFAAATNAASPSTQYGATLGSYVGVRLLTTGTAQAGSPVALDQTQYAQMYKGNDGHIHSVLLSTTSTPTATTVSSEGQATVDDLCSLSGANTLLGTTVNYVAEVSYADYQTPTNSVYFYRKPGASGVCNTSTDQVFMVKQGMSSTTAPVTALMPMAQVRNGSTGALAGFIVNEGTAITRYDQNFANRTVLMTPTTPISVGYSLGNEGPTSTGGLFVLDGSIVYINYAAGTVSAPLFTISNWDPTARIPASASGTALYFGVNTSNMAVKPVVNTSAVYTMPLDGSKPPSLITNESGLVDQIVAAEFGSTVAWSVVPTGGTYTIYSFTQGASAPVMALSTTDNAGTFVVTANAIYYTTWSSMKPTTTSVLQSGTSTGIVSMNGSVIQAPLSSSRFVAEEHDNNGSDWTAIIRARNLSPVTVVDATNSETYTEDGISGATLEVVSTSSNTVTTTLGTLPAGTIMTGAGTLTSTAGYIDGLNVNSTTDPKTRDLIYLDTSKANSAQLLTTNLH